MISKFIFIFTFLFTTSLYALDIEIIGPCNEVPLASGTIPWQEQSNLGFYSLEFLNSQNIPYQGSERGLNSIFNSPTGLDSLEVLSDNEMRSYGWCYELDGIQPDVFSHQVQIESPQSKITWFFGFAHYLNGEWVAQCVPSHKVQSEFICADQ